MYYKGSLTWKRGRQKTQWLIWLGVAGFENREGVISQGLWVSLEVGKGKKHIFFRECPEGTTLPNTLILASEDSFWTSDPSIVR